jgi:GNAT superfamily N-acetyltransferase/uncharacterized glyoxalase superfamily protein PhnB
MLHTGNRTNDKPWLMHVEPVLAVHDIDETIAYWTKILGFPDKWTWGDPPTHGGVAWYGSTFIQFSLNPERANASEGNSIWIRVRNLDALYALHCKQANVVAPLEKKPWGFAEYTVKDINGYYVNFAAPSADEGMRTQFSPGTVRIVGRRPTPSEFKNLAKSVGWTDLANSPIVETQLNACIQAVVAEITDSKEVIGCGLLMGDQVAFYYIKDVMVHPDWQHKGVGTLIMEELTRWFDANGPEHATVGLFTGEHLTSFYRQFGFIEACGMYRQARSNW